MNEKIDLFLDKKTAEVIGKTAEVLGTDFDGAVDRIILDYKNLRDGIGESVLTLPLEIAAAEGVRKKMKEENTDESFVLNAALSKYFEEEEKNFPAFDYDSPQNIINSGTQWYDSLRRSDEKFYMENERRVYRVGLSRESVMYLSRVAKCGICVEKTIDHAVCTAGRMIFDFEDRWNEKIPFSISAENMEYLRRGVRFGKTPWRIADNALEFTGIVTYPDA